MKYVRIFLGIAVFVGILVIPGRYAVARYSYMRNFRIVEEGKLYRSSQLGPDALSRVIHDHQINTVISFRYPEAGGAAPDAWEEEFCAKLGIRFLRIQPDLWASLDGGPIPAQKAVDQFLAVMKEPKNHPVLVHCFRGVHRTGSFCSVYRMECQGWSNEDAMNELRANGYDKLDQERDIHEYMSRYIPTAKRQMK